jgi:predicted membrane protein
MNSSNTRNMILSGFFIAIGLLLPAIFHLFGGAGKIFLPMHIPVLIAGFFLPPFYAAAVGLITPLLSSALTGMPVFYPILPIMMGELMVYGLVISLLSQNRLKNIWGRLIAGMIAGRVVAGLIVFVLAIGFGLKMNPMIYMQGALITGLPGLVIQFLLIPSLVILIQNRNQTIKKDHL